MLGAQSNDQLLVSLLLAALVEDTHVSLATVKGLGGLAQTTGQTVVDQRDLQNALESVQDGHLAAGTGISGNFDLVGGRDRDLFSVRLLKRGGVVSFGFCFFCFCVREDMMGWDKGREREGGN